MQPKFFKDQLDFREWLAENHSKETELLVGFYKVGSGKPSMSWPESVDQALSFGWIDGIRRSLGPESYSIRFTPRKPNSIWSAINIQKVNNLIVQGLMTPAGMKAFEQRTEERSRIYSFEKEAVPLSPAFEKAFKKNKKAWDFFTTQAPWYQKTLIHWVMGAKQAATQSSRLQKLIEASDKQEKLR